MNRAILCLGSLMLCLGMVHAATTSETPVPRTSEEAAAAQASAMPELNKDNADALAFRWLREYVEPIITEQERDAFLSLETPEERIAFIERFWKRRDPTPGTPENEARDEHMRRFSYANQNFGTGKPGWKTDRGRVYILLGAPQSRSSNPMGRTAGERASEVWTFNGVKSRSLPASFDLTFVGLQ